VNIVAQEIKQHEIIRPTNSVSLEGELNIPADAPGVVLFAHGASSSRHSPRNKYVASVIREAGIGTLLFDLLTPEEESIDNYTRELRFNIPLLAERLVAAANWLKRREDAAHLTIGFFGSSTGGAAALVAAAELGDLVGAVVSRGGRPDLAGDALTKVTSPVLLIVGGLDDVVIRLNEQAYDQLRCEKELKIVPGATHLFEETGTLETVAAMATGWFAKKMNPANLAGAPQFARAG
jgi:putative phosphoribosyl transferase